jgi:UTP--glucose-1-phosphate uridylyltransferase
MTFREIIVQQVLAVRAADDVALPLTLLNSFRTESDCLAALATFCGLAAEGVPLSVLQNGVPKLRADDLTSVSWPADPSLEWCPPGHGTSTPSSTRPGSSTASSRRASRRGTEHGHAGPTPSTA